METNALRNEMLQDFNYLLLKMRQYLLLKKDMFPLMKEKERLTNELESKNTLLHSLHSVLDSGLISSHPDYPFVAQQLLLEKEIASLTASLAALETKLEVPSKKCLYYLRYCELLASAMESYEGESASLSSLKLLPKEINGQFLIEYLYIYTLNPQIFDSSMHAYLQRRIPFYFSEKLSEEVIRLLFHKDGTLKSSKAAFQALRKILEQHYLKA